jgi:F-box and WD-40 domain protein MET30
MPILDGDPSDGIQDSLSVSSTHPSITPSPSLPPVPLLAFDAPSHDDVKNGAVALPPSTSETISTAQQQPARRLCARHQRMADEGTSLKLQQV